MAGLSEKVNTVPLPQIEAGKSESWVQILPAGKFDLNDTRGPWIVKDMAAVIARSQRDLSRGMPVDMDHALDRRNEAEAPAAGWIEELAARDDGIWARIAWTPTGKAKVDGRIPLHPPSGHGDEGGRSHGGEACRADQRARDHHAGAVRGRG